MFQDLDLGPYDLAREMGAYPYAILSVDYLFASKGMMISLSDFFVQVTF